MSQKPSQPPFAVFPDLNFVLRLPTGVAYRGKLRRHDAREPSEFWYEGYARAEGKDQITAGTVLKDAFARNAGRPAYFHPDSNVEPLRIKMNRIPPAKRNEKNDKTLISEFWTPDGLWTLICSPSESDGLHLAGTVVPSRAEMDFDGSKIRQFRPEPTEAGKAAPAPAKGRGGKPAARPS